jgi:ankyrin repeat protein
MRFGADIRIALRSLPPTLKGVYRIILDQIKMGGPWSGPLATKALRWLLCAQEPLCSSELLKALQSNSENSDDIITKEKLLDVCCNFVKYDGELDVFRFYHLSVREYLDDKDQEDDYGKSISNSSTALACVKSCMENFQPPRPQRKSILSKATTNTFVDYARVYWAFHCELSLDHRRRGELAKALKDFLAFRKGRADWGFIFFLKWWPVSWGNIHHSSATDDDFNLDELYLKLSITCDTLTDPINIACAFGFLEIVQDRCKSGIQNIENYGLSPFEIAVTCGQKEIVRFLVSDSSQQIFVDERVMEFAVIASRKEIAIYLLELDPSITFGKEIIYTAMKYANDDMLAFVLEKNEWTIEVTQKLLHLAVQNKSSSESPIKHIFDLNPMVPICEKIIIAACSNPRHGLKLMESLLPKYNGEFSEEVFECAASNSRLGAAILKLLFSIRPSSPPSIRLIEAAASNFKIESLELLLQRYQSVSISYEAILAAIENEDIGNQALPLLLSRCPASIIDEDLIIAAISNNVHGLELVKLLLKASNLSEVTEEVFEVAAALNWPPYFRVLEELFDHFPKFEVTSTMIVASLKNNDDDPTGTLDLLLKRSHGLEISSDVISASCSNIYYSMELLSYFRKHGYKIEMTKAMIGKIKRNYSALDIVKYLAENGDLHRTTDLLEAAVSNSRSGDKICAFLLSTGDQQITQRAIEQSTQNLFLGAEILSLLLRGNQHIDLSNGSLEIAAEWSFDPNVITILLSSGCTLNFDDCVTAAAAMNDDNSDHLLNIILADHRAPQPTSIVLETALSYRRLTLNAFKILMRAAPRESLTNNAFRNALGLNSRRIPILTDLLDRRPDIGLRDDELDLVLTSVHLDDRELIPQDSPEVLQYLMGQRKSFLISETLLKATVQHGKSLTILKIILSYCDNTAQIPPITEEVLESAFSTNSPDGPHVVVLLLGRMLTNNTFISPSEDLIIAAIRGTTEDSNMLQILIERLGPIALTQRILCETAKNASDCIDVLEVLRNNSPDTFAEVMHGSDFASSYLKNGDCSRQGLRYLKNLAPDRVLTISSELLCLAASNSTEMLRELISIIHEQDQDHLLPSLITEDVIKSICSSHSRSYSVIFNQSLQILRLTLKDHGRALPITTDILRSAMGCPLSGKSRESCILYLKRYIQILKQENRIHLLPSLITEDLIFASVKHHATKKFYKLFKPLLPPFHLDNLLTERLLSAAADNGGSEDDLHFLYDHIIPPPNKPFIHYHEISLFFDAIFTSNIAKIHKYCAKGIPTNTTDFNGLTPLAGAAEMCQIACVRELLKFVNEDPEKGVDLNAICKKGRTPLARAAKKGFSHIAHMLLEAGAKRDIKDLKGRTAEEIALKKRNFMVASMIRDWDAKNKDNHVVPAGQGEKSETAGGDGANEDIRRSLERLGNGEKEGPEKSGILRSQTF